MLKIKGFPTTFHDLPTSVEASLKLLIHGIARKDV